MMEINSGTLNSLLVLPRYILRSSRDLLPSVHNYYSLEYTKPIGQLTFRGYIYVEWIRHIGMKLAMITRREATGSYGLFFGTSYISGYFLKL